MKRVFKAYITHWSIPLYFTLVLALIAYAWILNPSQILSSLPIFLIPIAAAPFAEWVLHKFSLHRIVDPNQSPRSYNYMLKLHYKHHWEPNDLNFVFAPISASLLLFSLFIPIAFLFNSLTYSLVFMASVISYFLYYEWIHLAHHVPTYRALTRFGSHMRKAHSWHHYKNENYWWGVTNPLGDYLLGSFKDPKAVEFSPNAKSLGELKSNK